MRVLVRSWGVAGIFNVMMGSSGGGKGLLSLGTGLLGVFDGYL